MEFQKIDDIWCEKNSNGEVGSRWLLSDCMLVVVMTTVSIFDGVSLTVAGLAAESEDTQKPIRYLNGIARFQDKRLFVVMDADKVT